MRFLVVSLFIVLASKVIIGLSKWSMVDVFVIALIVAYMAGNANANSEDLLNMHAEFGTGFWYFTGYCLFAIAASSFIKPVVKTS